VFPNWVIRIEPAASQGSWNQARAIQCGPLGPSGEQGPTPLLYSGGRHVDAGLTFDQQANLTRRRILGPHRPSVSPLCATAHRFLSHPIPFSHLSHKLTDSPAVIWTDVGETQYTHSTQYTAHKHQHPPALGSPTLRLFPTQYLAVDSRLLRHPRSIHADPIRSDPEPPGSPHNKARHTQDGVRSRSPFIMAAPSGSIDPTKPAKYPIILSDALLGKSSKEAYTGVRCKGHA